MELALPLPLTNADVAVYVTAAITGLFGLIGLFAPQVLLSMLRLRTVDLHPEAVSEIRSTIGGFYVGIGLMGIMFFEQFTIPLVLGSAWALAAFGRLVSILSDQGSTVYNWLFLLLNLILAGLPLAALFGLITA